MAKKKENEFGNYITSRMRQSENNGNSFMYETWLFKLCQKTHADLTKERFEADMEKLAELGTIHRDKEKHRAYLTNTWEYEGIVSETLPPLLNHLDPPVDIPDPIMQDDLVLEDEQRQAVELVMTHRFSVIKGGAGTGKTTIVRAIVIYSGADAKQVIICAPTGKAARNLADRAGLPTATAHSVLDLRPDEDLITYIIWQDVQLVVVDEASMLTLELLTGLLSRMNDTCRIVLLGDPEQLQSIGAGNVLEDLEKIQVPSIVLQQNHRLAGAAGALIHNVSLFQSLKSPDELQYDDSFQFYDVSPDDIASVLLDMAVRGYQKDRSMIVLTPFHLKKELSSDVLNEKIQARLNPASDGKAEMHIHGCTFRDGDRVIITKNDRMYNVSNGDVGIFHIHPTDWGPQEVTVAMEDGRIAHWIEDDIDMAGLDLAYVLTVHKSQGSEYDTVIMPISMEMTNMLDRHLFYTAISRARQNVVLIGEPAALKQAMTRKPRRRDSSLPSRVAEKMAPKQEQEDLPR